MARSTCRQQVRVSRGRRPLPCVLIRAGTGERSGTGGSQRAEVRALAEKALFLSLVLTPDGGRLAAEIALSDQDQSDIWTNHAGETRISSGEVDGGAQVVWVRICGPSSSYHPPTGSSLCTARTSARLRVRRCCTARATPCSQRTSPDGRYLALHMNHSSAQMVLVCSSRCRHGPMTGEPVAVRHSGPSNGWATRSRTGKRIGLYVRPIRAVRGLRGGRTAGRIGRRGEALESKFRRWRTGLGGGAISRSCCCVASDRSVRCEWR